MLKWLSHIWDSHLIPITVLGVNTLVVSLPTIILVLTFISLLIQIAYTTWKWYKGERK